MQIKTTLHFIVLSLVLLFKIHGEVPIKNCEFDKNLELFFETHKIHYLSQIRFFTYLYAAQNDAKDDDAELYACLAERLAWIFYPDLDFPLLAFKEETATRAATLLAPYVQRIELENVNKATFLSSCWLDQHTESLLVAKWISWATPILKPPPPSALSDSNFWNGQIERLKEMQNTLTARQREIVGVWVGCHGPGCSWRSFANQYMKEHNVDPLKILLVRSILMKGLYDGKIAEMHAKYTHCIPRPPLMFPLFKPLIKVPKTPSYPSGHGIQGAIFAVIFSYFFPEHRTFWHQLDVEGANTRLWGGVHFPIDVEQGRLLGNQIAMQTLFENDIILNVGQEVQLQSAQSQMIETSLQFSQQ